MGIDLPQGPARVDADPLCVEELVALEAQFASAARGYWKAARLVRWAITKRNAPEPDPAQLRFPFSS